MVVPEVPVRVLGLWVPKSVFKKFIASAVSISHVVCTVYICTYINIYIYICMYVFRNIFTRFFIHAYTHVYIHAHAHESICTNANIYIHMFGAILPG